MSTASEKSDWTSSETETGADSSARNSHTDEVEEEEVRRTARITSQRPPPEPQRLERRTSSERRAKTHARTATLAMQLQQEESFEDEDDDETEGIHRYDEDDVDLQEADTQVKPAAAKAMTASRPVNGPKGNDWMDAERQFWLKSAESTRATDASVTLGEDDDRKMPPATTLVPKITDPGNHAVDSNAEDNGRGDRKPSAKRRSSTPAKRKKPADYQFHPNSKWLEPPREEEDNNLTLWEVHRKPRRVISGRIQRPIKALYSNFRCVICLGFIRDTRIVTECLHRFCEECIEKSLRLGKHECPICRVPVPSRRSLAADKAFDRLIDAILGDAVYEDAQQYEEEALQETERARRLQEAIHQKRKADSFASHDRSNEVTPVVQEEPVATDLPSMVEIKLVRHARESKVDELNLPFLRMQGDASVGVLKTFLCQKLDQHHSVFEILCKGRRKEEELDDWITLEEAVSRSRDRYDEDGEQSDVTLMYRTA